MKKTIIALAAASSVALSHGVAVAEPVQEDQVASAEQTTNGSSELKNKLTLSSERSTEPEDGEKPSATGSSKIFGWEDDASPVDKLIKIGAAVAAVVSLLGSISALFANIEKIVKQFTK